MKKSFTEEQIIGILKEQESGGLKVSDARKLRDLRDENNKLKELLEEQMLDNAMLRNVNSKKWWRIYAEEKLQI